MLTLTLFILNLFVAFGSSGKVGDNCNTCRDIVKNFKKGLDKTAKDHFGGGDTAWEESRLGSFARSETRLLEILEGACEGAAKESRCHAVVEEYEEKIEEYWFNKHKELDQLEKYLCIDTMQACCPEGQYGKECKDCPGGLKSPCNGHGTCKGSGTREGNGKCKCDDAYQGDLCDECSEKYYKDTNGSCLACDESCESSCSDGTNKGCDSCKEGYVQDEDQACVDKNECDEDDTCVEGKFCVNSKGSYECKDCHTSCEGGCTGASRFNCVQCKSGWKAIEDQQGCEDVNECEGEHGCSAGTYCKNTDGTHDCLSCHSSCSTEGCTGEGPDKCLACSNGWEMNSEEGTGCVDVDQCKTKEVQCKHGEVCVNSEGPDKCEACHETCKECVGTEAGNCLSCYPGFALIDSKCKDINECSNDPCNKKTENCNNTPGSYSCKCKKGWVRTKQGDCKKKKTKTKKKNKKGTKKEKSWKDDLYDDIMSGKAFEKEENFRKFMYGHVVVAAFLMIMYRYRCYNLLALSVGCYAVVASYVYTKHGKNIF